MKRLRSVLVASFCGMSVLVSTIVFAENLQNAVKQALSSNPEVQSALEERLVKGQLVKQAFSGYLPVLDVLLGAGAAEINEPVESSLNPTEFDLSLRQNLFSGFSTKYEVQRRESDVQSADFLLQARAEEVALRTARTYLNVLRSTELDELARENLNNHQRIADQIKLRSESGISRKADMNHAEGRLAQAQSNVIVTATNLIDARTNYAAVTGQTPDTLDMVEEVQDIPVTIDEAVSQAVANHPTLKSAESEITAQQAFAKRAESPFYPNLDIEVTQNWDEDVDGIEGSQDELVAMVRLRYNIFNGMQDQERKVETKALIRQAQANRDTTQRQVVEGARLAYMAHDAAEQRISYLEKHVEAGLRTVESYTKQWNIGQRTLLDVLDSERELIEAKKDLIDARFDKLLAQFRLLNSSGALVRGIGLEALDHQSDDQKSDLAHDQGANTLEHVDGSGDKASQQENIPARNNDVEERLTVTQVQAPAPVIPVEIKPDDMGAGQLVSIDSANNEKPALPNVPALPEEKLVLQVKSNSDYLKENEYPVLKDFAAVLIQHPEASIVVKGYVSSLHNSQPNIKLSERRADNVRKYLCEMGVLEEQVTVIGMGNQHPVASNATAAGRLRNRRVEIEIKPTGMPVNDRVATNNVEKKHLAAQSEM